MAFVTTRPPNAPTTGSAAELPVLEVGFLESLFDGDPETLREIVGVFRATIPAQFAALEHALDRGPEEVRRNAHTLKGALRQIGARESAHHAASLENSSQAGAELLRPMLSTLRSALDRLDAVLAARFPNPPP